MDTKTLFKGGIMKTILFCILLLLPAGTAFASYRNDRDQETYNQMREETNDFFVNAKLNDE